MCHLQHLQINTIKSNIIFQKKSKKFFKHQDIDKMYTYKYSINNSIVVYIT